MHTLDYTVTWNCTHIASGETKRELRHLNAELGLHVPVICTPEELMMEA